MRVMDGERRGALIETKARTGGRVVTTLVPVKRFQLGNHLGTLAVELDEDRELISYEE